VKLLAALASGAFAVLAVGSIAGVQVVRARRAPGQGIRLRSWLIQAGTEVSPAVFIGMVLAVAGVSLAVFVAVTGSVVIALFPSAAVAALPILSVARRRARRMDEVAEAWPDGLRDLIASVASGMSLARALDRLADRGPAPLQRAFAGFPLMARTVGVVAALEIVKTDLADPASDRVIEILALAHERGGSIVPQILDDLAGAATQDLWALEEIRTQSLEQKINARAVFVLPWLVLVALTIREGAFRDFYQSAAGVFVVIVGAALSAIGMLLVARLGREPEEPRVFGGGAK
jgi:tight adherence protein B